MKVAYIPVVAVTIAMSWMMHFLKNCCGFKFCKIYHCKLVDFADCYQQKHEKRTLKLLRSHFVGTRYI